jgi:flagellar L-ring protein precursor FlgH
LSSKRCLIACLAWGLVTLAANAQTTSGSMINPDTYRGLAADQRAHQVGDTLTVVVTETARASASADTDADSNVQLGANTQTHNGTHNYALGLSGSDAGQGKTSRAGTLQAQLAVRVVDVEGDGMLRIHGEQTVVVNGEKQQFALTGLVRSEDISATNTILSNRISEANIQFTGHGDVSEAQRRSILYRITRWLGLI